MTGWPLLMSTGLTIVNVVLYSTLPLALRGASRMSVMTALRRSAGSISPTAMPLISSYGPTVPNDWPLNIADVVFVIVILVTRASRLAAASTSNPAAAVIPRRAPRVSRDIGDPPMDRDDCSVFRPELAGTIGRVLVCKICRCKYKVNDLVYCSAVASSGQTLPCPGKQDFCDAQR